MASDRRNILECSFERDFAARTPSSKPRDHTARPPKHYEPRVISTKFQFLQFAQVLVENLFTTLLSENGRRFLFLHTNDDALKDHSYRSIHARFALLQLGMRIALQL